MGEQARSARQAAAESVISNVIGVLTIVGISLLLARRDWIIRQAVAARASWRRDARRWREEREVAEFRRRVSDFDQGDRT